MVMSLLAVLELNSLQNAMMLMPCGPSAGPTGGAGLALPAWSCSLTMPETFFAMTVPLLLRGAAIAHAGRSQRNGGLLRERAGSTPPLIDNSDPLLHLSEIQLDRGRSPEDRHLDPDLLLVGFDLFPRAREVRERPVDDPDLVARLERHPRLGLDRPLHDALPELVDLGRRHLPRLLLADETGDLRRVLHEVPDLLGHLHLDEDVAGEDRLLAGAALPAGASLGDRFGRDEHLAEAILHVVLLDALEEGLFDLGLVARVGLDDEPLLGH